MTTRVAYQGVPGANSEIATLGYFGEGVEPVPTPSFAALVDSVLAGQTDFGVLPIENSLAGSVIDSYDLLIDRPVFIVGELYQHVRYQLLALPGVKLEEVRRVYSHPQALAQSADYLRAHPALEPEAAFDTAGAAKLVAERGLRDAAAIAPALAGVRYGLTPLASDIQSHAENYTRMVVLAATEQEPKAGGVVKTSVIAGLRHEPGSLATLLSILQRAGMNLTKIESRPIIGKPWEYLFYLDWEGRLEGADLNAASAATTLWKRLGVYARGPRIEAR
ncbi:MAG TPA: prephenate dehydratase [Dehalococcoidia bacterium]|jgi:prephenate dehydratase